MQRLWFYSGMIAILLASSLSPASAQGQVGPCQIFPDDNYWNRDVSADPVHPQSAAIIANIDAHRPSPNSRTSVWPDFGGNVNDWYGIPWFTVDNSQPALDKSDISFLYEDESDNGPYPVPWNAPVEGGPNADPDADRHILVINTDTCVLSEIYNANQGSTINTWDAGSGAIFDLNSNALRPDKWTSADAAGLPIFPGLARCDEASAGPDGIQHALRFTLNAPRVGPGGNNDVYVFPARHEAGSNTDPMSPPFGARLRLRADFDETKFHGQALAIVRALKRYGMIVSDIGSNWYITGDYPFQNGTGCLWNNTSLNELKGSIPGTGIPGTAFEVLAYPGTAGPLINTFSTLTPTLNWGRLTWASSYEIQVSANSLFSPLADSKIVSTTSTSVTVPKPGQYFFRVRGKDATGTAGAWSAPGTFNVAILN